MKSTVFLPVLVICMITCFRITNQLDIVYAVNCGGNAHTDSNGVKYQRDPSTEGNADRPWASMGGINSHDKYLYFTFRYGDGLDYELPLTGDGWYGLLLHLGDDSSPTTVRRRLQVKLNGQHTLLGDFDFYNECGFNIACNQIFYFKVCGDTLHFGGQQSTIWGNKLNLAIRHHAVNSLINGILLVKGHHGEGLPIVGTKTVLFFDPKKDVQCPGSEGIVECVTKYETNYYK